MILQYHVLKYSLTDTVSLSRLYNNNQIVPCQPELQLWSRNYMLLPLLTFTAFTPQFQERLGQLPLSITLEQNLYNFLLLRYLPAGYMRHYLSVMDVLFMTSHALKSTINKWLNTGNKSQREWLCCIKASWCSLHYCEVYKSLINQIIEPRSMISPSFV